MLTPQQIQDISFEKALFGGYDMDSVVNILEPLTEDYVTLYKENSVLKSKMRILVEKLEEYRKQEASMQNALLAPRRRRATRWSRDAEKKCAQMLHEAEGCRQRQDEQCRRPRRARSRSASMRPRPPRRSSWTAWKSA